MYFCRHSPPRVDDVTGIFLRLFLFLPPKGQTGAWKEKLSPEQSARIDKYLKEKLGDSDIKIKYAAS